MVFLLLRNEDKLHYVYIKKLYRFLYNKTKHKEKSYYKMPVKDINVQFTNI